MTENSSVEKDLGWCLMKNSARVVSTRSQPRKQTIPWAVSKGVWSAGQGRRVSPSPLLLRDPTWSGVYSFDAFKVRAWKCWSKPRGEPQSWWEVWSTSLADQVATIRAVKPREGKTAWRPYSNPLGPEVGLREAGKGLRAKNCSDRNRSNVYKQKDGKFRLDV